MVDIMYSTIEYPNQSPFLHNQGEVAIPCMQTGFSISNRCFSVFMIKEFLPTFYRNHHVKFEIYRTTLLTVINLSQP